MTYTHTHTHTHTKVTLLWRRDQPEAETSYLHYTTHIKDEYPCLQRDSSQQSQQVSNRRPTALTARSLGSAALFSVHKIILILYMAHFPLFEFFPSVKKLFPFRRARLTFSPYLRSRLLSPSCLLPDFSNNCCLISIPNRQI
jgi:hypothetical protein